MNDTVDLAPGPADRPSTQFDRDSANVVVARRWLTECLEAFAVPADRIAEAEVIISELVTNVFRHTRSAATVFVSATPGEVRVDVHDDEGASLPVLQPVDPTRVGGNGIRILDAFASTWGYERLPDGGKDVWFTVSW